MVTGKFRGYDIEVNEYQEWVFSDTQKPISEDKNIRPCKHCNQIDTKEGYDGCLGHLKGVMNACCGHGVDSDAYIQFLDGECLRGYSALIVARELKKT